MTDDVGMEPLGVIVARLVESLAGPMADAGGFPARTGFGSGRGGNVAASPPFTAATTDCIGPRHSGQRPELNGLAASSGRTEPTASVNGRAVAFAAVLEFVGKKGGDRSRPQWVLQGGEHPTAEVGRTSTRQTVALRYRR